MSGALTSVAGQTHLVIFHAAILDQHAPFISISKPSVRPQVRNGSRSMAQFDKCHECPVDVTILGSTRTVVAYADRFSVNDIAFPRKLDSKGTTRSELSSRNTPQNHLPNCEGGPAVLLLNLHLSPELRSCNPRSCRHQIRPGGK